MRLTASGWAVLCAAVVLYAAGLALGYPELMVLAGAGLLALAVGAAFVVYRPRLRVARHVEPAQVVVGQPALGLLEVENLSVAPRAGLVATDPVGPDRLEVDVPRLAPRARTFVHYPIPTRRRGRFPHGPVTVLRADPLGLVSNAQTHGSVGTLWVYPRTHPLRPLPASVVLELEGPITEASPRGTLTFSSLREYVAGDDPRHIHWRSTARTGTLMVSEHVDSSQPRTTVALDTRSEAWSDLAFEHGVEAAASLATSFHRGGHPVSLVLGRDGARPEPGMSLLDRLAEVERTDEPEGWRLPWLLEHATPGGALVVVTGPLDPATFGRLTAQRRRFAPVILVSMGADKPLASARRSGTTVMEAATSRDFAAGWNHLVHR